MRREAAMRLTWKVLPLLGALCAACAAPAPVSPVDEIVAAHLAARCGAEKLRSLRSIRESGKVTASGGRIHFAGRHFAYACARIAQLPVQQPLPCWIGGSSPAAIRRTARLGSGWLAGIQPPEEVARVIAAIHAALAESGRTIDPDHYGATLPCRIGALPSGLADRFRRAGAEVVVTGQTAAGVARARAYLAAGATKLVLIQLARGTREVMDQVERLIGDVIPAVEAKYSVQANRESRALAGLSMGGGQSLNFALAHLDTLAWIGGFSSAPNTKPPTQLLPDAAAAKEKLKLLWLGCGNKDGLMRISQGVHRHLNEKGIPHVWHVDSNGHGQSSKGYEAGINLRDLGGKADAEIFDEI